MHNFLYSHQCACACRAGSWRQLDSILGGAHAAGATCSLVGAAASQVVVIGGCSVAIDGRTVFSEADVPRVLSATLPGSSASPFTDVQWSELGWPSVRLAVPTVPAATWRDHH